MNRAKYVRWLVMYPVLALGGCHMLMTGFPIPLWHIEALSAPLAVRSTTETHLILENGRRLSLPFIVKIPHDNPLFQAAISGGVEVHDDGTAHGRMWLDRSCGNDPVVWRLVRVNLSDLAGALQPTGINPSVVSPVAIAELKERGLISIARPTRVHRKGHLSVWDLRTLRIVHQQFEYSTSLTERN